MKKHLTKIKEHVEWDWNHWPDSSQTVLHGVMAA